MNKIWGYSLHITLQNCNPQKIRDEKYIAQSFEDIVKQVKMTPYGKTQAIRFGKDPEIVGYSAILFLEESNLTGHFVDYDNSGHIDLFSCKFFETEETVSFIKNIFNSNNASYCFMKRGYEIEIVKTENNI